MKHALDEAGRFGARQPELAVNDVRQVGAPDGIGRLLRRATGLPAPDALAAAARGERAALDALDAVAERAGRVLAILATLLDPQVIVLGGAIAAAGDVLMGPLRRAYGGALHERPLRATPALAASPLAERGTVLGAVRVALDDLVPRLIDLGPAGATMG